MNTEPFANWDCSRWRPTEVVALGYMDGPTGGILRFIDDRAWSFDVVAYDLDRELRVVTLGVLRNEDYDLIVNTLSRTIGAPRWPIWVPLWKFDHLAQRRETEDIINGITANAVPVAAAVCDDTLMRCVSFRSLDVDEVRDARAWLEFMGLQGSRTSVR